MSEKMRMALLQRMSDWLSSEVSHLQKEAFDAGYAAAYIDCSTAEFGKEGPSFNDWSLRGSNKAFEEYLLAGSVRSEAP